jgi:hypothetical protein
VAKLAGKKTISQDEMSQEINLKRYLGDDATPEQKQLFAELAIEQINQRTLDGKTIHGGNFKKYSKEYADFKGVSRDSVDLFLEGDMLDSLETQEDGNKIKITIGGDSVETAKGYNHHVGDTLPKRPWFGLTTDEVRSITDAIAVEADVVEQETFTIAELSAALRELGLTQERE